MVRYTREPTTYLSAGLIKYGNSNKYFPDTDKGLKWGKIYFEFLENGGDAYNSQRFRDYLEVHNEQTA